MTNRLDVTMRLAATLLVASMAALGCSRTQPSVPIVVPGAATTAPSYLADGAVPAQRYVIRMSDGRRDWEVEFPETAGGYEMRIPLETTSGNGDGRTVEWEGAQLTDADKELLRELRRQTPGMEREGIYADGKNVLDAAAGKPAAAPAGEADAAPTRPSYLLGVETVNKLFKTGNFELAMVRLVNLERAYPDDLKLLSMKGTLWLRLGRVNLARQAWEEVLQIDPDNKPVLRALKRLNDQ